MISGNNMNRRRVIFALASVAGLLLFFGDSRVAGRDGAVPDASWGLAELMRSLGRKKHGSARFRERRYIGVLTQPIDLSGTLSFTPPDRLEKNTLSPKWERLVVEGDRLTIDVELDAPEPAVPGPLRHQSLTLADYPEIRAFIECIRGTLAGDLDALERFYDLRVEGEAESWKLILTPREEKMRSVVTAIRVGGSQERIDSIEIGEANGDRSVMTVSPDRP
jgi:hypothetical protein